MKKILLIAISLLGAFTAQAAETASNDSVYVVKNGAVVSAHEIAEGDYVTFTRPESAWHVIKKNASFYTYNNGAYTFPYTNTSDIWQDGTENSYAIENFLGSGDFFYFSIAPSDSATFVTTDISTWAGEFVPQSNVSSSESFGYTYYNYYSTSGETSSWSWTDATNGITYNSFGFYGAPYSDVASSCISIGGYIQIDGGESTWTYLYGDMR